MGRRVTFWARLFFETGKLRLDDLYLRRRRAFIKAAKAVSNVAIAPTPPIVHHALDEAGPGVAIPTDVSLLMVPDSRSRSRLVV